MKEAIKAGLLLHSSSYYKSDSYGVWTILCCYRKTFGKNEKEKERKKPPLGCQAMVLMFVTLISFNKNGEGGEQEVTISQYALARSPVENFAASENVDVRFKEGATFSVQQGCV